MRLISTLWYTRNDENFMDFVKQGVEEAHERKDNQMEIAYMLISVQILLQKFEVINVQKTLKKINEIFEQIDQEKLKTDREMVNISKINRLDFIKIEFYHSKYFMFIQDQ